MKNKLDGIISILLLGALLLTQTFDLKLLVVSIILSVFTFLRFAKEKMQN